MGRTVFTVKRFTAIERLLRDGLGIREIARGLKVSRRIVREVRDGLRASPNKPKTIAISAWMERVNWAAVLHDRAVGRPLKDIWRQHAQAVTTYSSFWKQLQRWFPPDEVGARTLHAMGVSPQLSIIEGGKALPPSEPAPTEVIPSARRTGRRRQTNGASTQQGHVRRGPRKPWAEIGNYMGSKRTSQHWPTQSGC